MLTPPPKCLLQLPSHRQMAALEAPRHYLLYLLSRLCVSQRGESSRFAAAKIWAAEWRFRRADKSSWSYRSVFNT